MPKLTFEGSFPELVDKDGRPARHQPESEGLGQIEVDDAGASLTIELFDPGQVFVRVQSWDEALQHNQMRAFLGKRLRVTVETLDEDSDITQ